ncbi:MAG: hypothetical protein JXE07_09820, partial [Candidatus Aminicenantes bacterium]|nr:hypothetical protein [Candidatus Aminicenantes bacterium]
RSRLWGAAVGLLTAALMTAGPGPASAAAEGPSIPQDQSSAGKSARFDVPAASSKIEIDGVLDETGWRNAAVIPLLYEWTPGDNILPPVKTDCLVTYDLNNLYVAFRCTDPEPGKIRAHLMDRDDTDTLILDDHVNFMVDSFNDERRGFQFRINPLGVQADANFSELEGYEDFSWDAIWASAGKITDWGYAVETAIPLNQLRFRRQEGPQTWGFSAERSWPRDARHRITSHVRSRNVGCILCQFNKLTGFEGITPSRNIELTPTVTAGRTDAMDMAGYPESPLGRGEIDDQYGLTAKWGVTPNLILNAALNPDFSQVEADVAQLEINRRFALFYPEKRPFFLEGADFFLTPIQAVFTRTVADPHWGAKMTGKMGRTALGFFAAQDNITTLVIPSNQGSFPTEPLGQDAFGGVFRIRQDVGKGSTLGVLYTGKSGDDYGNHVGGIDGFLRFDQKNTLSFQFLHSETDYPDDFASAYGQNTEGFGGNGLRLDYMHFSRDWIIQGQYEDTSAGFRADYGFVPRVDVRSGTALVFRQIWGKPGGWFNYIRLGVLGQAVYDHEETLTDRNLTLGVMYQGNLETVVNVHGNFARTYYEGEYFDTVNGDLTFQIRPFSGSQFGLQGVAGQTVDFANLRLANVMALSPRGSFMLGRHLNVTASLDYERLFLEADTIYTATIIQGRLIYNFSTRAFVRAIVQYRDTERDAGMYLLAVDPRSRAVFTQFLFSYKLNPRTVLFLGYSDNSQGGEFFGLERIDITRINRTFFLKIGYAWQL